MHGCEVSFLTNEKVLNAVFYFNLHLNGLINDANDEGNFNFQPYLPCEKKAQMKICFCQLIQR